ncbi:MAG: ectoine synthase [Halorhodospira halophila]|uniref:ectoine synthase n=1 Tax=Halorhodospira TaxID=85108 RepID=UPI001EE96929|nr:MULTISPECIES: ectoine synthase [Halorhodospira]MCC3749915.1 ectoine synthase [Halorhodospira halophila]MCG5527835.1 ectoine synthase [Halorhodospira halophila]MCG5539724.1 ectoine synthase [Halorhodospira sp. M39old]MCG5542295.1 ectoine synthase [Halorhodospira sp. 9628]MCG5545534.1 ectoine synthase [Halorhodospira sp. M38]
MIVRHMQDIIGSDREVETDEFISRRIILKEDGMGFSFHETIIKAGTNMFIWYANHLESVYCISGKGAIEVVGGETYTIEPGMLYGLDGHEKHYLRAEEELRLMCVFNPPLTGREVHDENGTYPLLD